jgi:hypothetical protein
MREENDRHHSGQRPAAGPQAGFALVLAIMALMLLTFLGLTLATTTSTELQIATNYRWSQQAYYNAEAGIEAGKLALEALTSASRGWQDVLPPDRTLLLPPLKWDINSGTAAAQPTPLPLASQGSDAWGQLYRNYENANCDARGGHVGYGVILNGMQNVTTLFPTTAKPQQLNGAVTVWIRRGFGQNMDGTFTDDSSNSRLVITAEGVAPFAMGTSTMAFAAANKAVRVLEASVIAPTVVTGGTQLCERASNVSGSGFQDCGITGDNLQGLGCDASKRAEGGSRGSESAGSCGTLNAN